MTQPNPERWTLSQWLSWLEGIKPRPQHDKLKILKSVANKLNVLPLSVPVITIGGSNGKGTCVATLQAIYKAAGYNVASFTSPHLLHFNERITLFGEPVEDEVLCQAFYKVYVACERAALHYFAFILLVALIIFQQNPLDVILLEVGLGGRLDPVNIVDPDVSIITNVSLEHQAILGETRQAIAQEKAGIMRPTKPIILGEKDLPFIIGIKDSPCYVYGRDFFAEGEGKIWQFQGSKGRLDSLHNPGLHLHSMACALMALTCLNLPVKEKAITQALAQLKLPGRMQRIAGPPSMILDVAHNPASCTYLAQQLLPYKGRLHGLCAMGDDKDAQASLVPLLPLVTHWHVTPLKTQASADALAKALAALAVQEVDVYESIPEALEEAKKILQKGEILLIFGSFYLVSEVLYSHL